MTISRRTFLKGMASAALAQIAPGLLHLSVADAAAAGDYRACVCIFLHGGNDGSNSFVPLDDRGYGEYSHARGKLALPAESLLAVTTNGAAREFGFHPSLTGVRGLFNQGHVAVLANVGVLRAPITREQYLGSDGAVPPRLFSHSDQMRLWQSPRAARTTKSLAGWGGMMADALATYNGAALYPGMTTMSGSSTYCEGRVTRPAAVHPTNNGLLKGYPPHFTAEVRRQALDQLIASQSGRPLVDAVAASNRRMLDELMLLDNVFKSYPALQTGFPTSGLGMQLRRVAQLIQGREMLGLNRQMFFVSIGGFDTHDSQLSRQAAVLAQLDAAMLAFYRATEEIGVASQVLTFTLSEFGRTVSSANGGSDHGWGSHHLVMGGSVAGRDVYGTFPSLQLGGPDDAGDKGRLIPTTSVDQYGATVAAWMGVDAPGLGEIFPNLVNFDQPILSFV